MAQETLRYKRSLSGSIGAGMKSVMGSSKKYYILEHKVSSKYHQAGESQEIIVDQIEIGRSSSCQVRYDESFSTVSRKHAAIVKEGENWKIVPLSSTNSTFLNGHRIQKEWYLQNGDEIQLSVNGPKLGFIIPMGKKATVGSIGLSRRLSLFRQQALRPYKTAIATLACFILLLSCGGGYKLYQLQEENWKLEKAMKEQLEEMDALKKRNEILANDILSKGETIDTMNKQIEELKKRPPKIIKVVEPVVVPEVDNVAIDKCLPHIFYIQTIGFEITFPDGTKTTAECGKDKVPGWSGTGFLLSDGRFVTARHVTEGWYFFANGGKVDEMMLNLNAIAHNGGKVVAHFIAVSSSGKQLRFTSEQFRCDRSTDSEKHAENGYRVVMAHLDHTDYAYYNTGETGLPFNASQSSSLERGTKLTVLGFPLGHGVNQTGVNPIYGSVIVSANGLQRGIILTTDTNYEQGNSGGPVFYTNNKGVLEVVGIVSAGQGRNIGFVVPISAVK